MLAADKKMRRRPTREEFSRRCQELYEHLTAVIRSETARSGQLLPPEDQLARDFQLSRMSVRKVIEQLRQQKLLTKINGKGIVVGEPLPKVNSVLSCLLVADKLHSSRSDIRPDQRPGFFVGLLESELVRRGLRVQLTTCNSLLSEGIGQTVARLKQENLRGVISIYNGEEMNELNRCLANEGFSVMDVRSIAQEHSTVSVICYDNYMVGKLATAYLLEQGHRKLACIGSLPEREWERERMLAFSDLTKCAGDLDPERVIRCAGPEELDDCYTYWEGVGQAAVDAVLARPEITGVFCINDGVAAGFCRELQVRGLRVPEDFSVVGCDNNYDYLDLELDTVSLECHQAGIMAAEIMEHQLRNEGAIIWPTMVKVPPLLVPRRSVGAPRNRTIPQC